VIVALAEGTELVLPQAATRNTNARPTAQKGPCAEAAISLGLLRPPHDAMAE
jgi:hypothetical protein